MAKQPIDFWFSIGSMYTYLAVMRLPEVAAKSGTTFRWRPFSVRAIMIEMDNVPRNKPLKLAYMWRDLRRRAQMHGFPFRQQPSYPLQNFDLANRIAVVGAEEGWCADYARAAYRRWFLDHDEAGSDSNNQASLREVGHDPERVIERTNSEEVGAKYLASTDEARKLGIFGAPTFVVGQEIFWGDDRLEDALAWRQKNER
ncbi:MAG TPA: 2-hydroxychromene-2-carboxylate isomerase [Hyphomicrobiaceae bacterium]|nr:2-hydroxychromene-2-carboxylate isomerase [Hyphomicrobiaceae bacterium]